MTTLGDNLHLEIGDLIYIVSDEKQTVVPAVVTDELIHRTQQGRVVSWKVQIGPRRLNRVVDTRSIKGTIYNDLGKVRDALLNRVCSYLDHLMGTVAKDSKDWYDKDVDVPFTGGGLPVPGDARGESGAAVVENSLDADTLLSGIRSPEPDDQSPSIQETSVVLQQAAALGRPLTKDELKIALMSEINPDLVIKREV